MSSSSVPGGRDFEALLSLAAGAMRGPGGDSRRDEALGGLFARQTASSPLSGAEAFDGASVVRELRSISPRLHAMLLKCWMSEEDLDAELYQVVAASKERGSAVLEDYSRPEIRALRAACARVDREIERFVGLARFSLRPDGLHAACIEPDHNIAGALLPRLAPRFGESPFAIVDKRRLIAVERRGGHSRFLSGPEALGLLSYPCDAGPEELWKRYYRVIEDPLRRNPGLRRALMPRRYWKHLPEMENPA
jgi:probable DNA metabolism protein